jgi:hypothetical protein
LKEFIIFLLFLQIDFSLIVKLLAGVNGRMMAQVLIGEHLLMSNEQTIEHATPKEISCK